MDVLIVTSCNERANQRRQRRRGIAPQRPPAVVPRPAPPRGRGLHVMDAPPVVRQLRTERRSVLPRQRRVVPLPRDELPPRKLAEHAPL